MPTPVITHTCRPSVTGDGVDMFCFRSMWLVSASGRFQATACLRRSTAHSSRLPLLAPVATFRKIVSPQTIGVEPLYAGSGRRQATFVVSKSVHASGVMGRPSPKPPPRPPRPCAAGADAGAPLLHVAPHVVGNPVSGLAPVRE